MLVYIAGSGAMGSTIGYHIEKNTNSQVILLDTWKDHIDKINEDGLGITGKVNDKLKIRSMRFSEAKDKADLIVVMSKSMALYNTMKNISHLIDENTQILCLLNGMGHEEILEKFVNLDQINIGVTIWAAELKGPGHVEITGKGTIDLQNIGGNEASGKKISSLLDEAGLDSSYDEDVMYAIWRKVMVNGTMNSTSALLECTIGEFFSSDSHEKIIDELVSEFVEVGNAYGVGLDKEDMLAYIYETSKSVMNHYPSMYQDLIERNRKTEIDFINGAVVRKGEAKGIATPYNKIISQLIHAKEDIRKAK